MCDTNRCAACRPAKDGYGLGDFLVDLVLAVGWVLRKSPKVIVPVVAVMSWACWVWFSGRTWRHHVTRRWLRREVRAAGNWLLTALVVGLVLAPLATLVTVVALAGSLGAGLAWSHRARLRELGWTVRERLGLPSSRHVIRVRAEVER